MPVPRNRYLVCEYYPPGNVIGEFGVEVQGQINGTQQCLQGAICSGAHRALTIGGYGLGISMVIPLILLFPIAV